MRGDWDASAFRAVLGRKGWTLAEFERRFRERYGWAPGYSTMRQRWAQDGGRGPHGGDLRRMVVRLLGVKVSELWRRP